MRAALYYRVSTTDQDCELQRQDLRRYVTLRNWTMVKEYQDHGISGAQRDRPALNELLQDVRKGQFDVVLVWRFDRMARSTAHLLEILETLNAHSCQFASFNENIDTSTSVGRMVFVFLAAIAQFERDLIKERSAAGVAVARAAGKRFGAPEKHKLPAAVIQAALQEHGSQKNAAKALGVPLSTLRHRIRKLTQNISPIETEVVLESAPQIATEATTTEEETEYEHTRD